jgi:hypothetical protein
MARYSRVDSAMLDVERFLLRACSMSSHCWRCSAYSIDAVLHCVSIWYKRLSEPTDVVLVYGDEQCDGPCDEPLFIIFRSLISEASAVGSAPPRAGPGAETGDASQIGKLTGHISPQNVTLSW